MMADSAKQTLARANQMQALYDGFCANQPLAWLVDKMTVMLAQGVSLQDSAGKTLAQSGKVDVITHREPVRLDNIVIAQLCLGQVSTPDLVTVRRCAALLAAQLQRTLLLDSNAQQAPSYLLADLVSGRPVNQTGAEIRQGLQLNATGALYMVTIGGEPGESFEARLQTAFQTLKLYIPLANCLIYNSAYVAIIDEPAYTRLFGNSQRKFRQFVLHSQLSVGVSMPFTDILKTHRQYENARKALAIGQTRGQQLMFFADCTLQVIGEMVVQRYDPADLCHPAILQLIDYDAQHDADLLATLKAYLYYTENPQRAADKLHIHRNTLFYRINRIKALTGVTLTNGEERCRLFLSMRMLEENQSAANMMH